MNTNKTPTPEPAFSDELLLDDIYRADDPAIRQYLNSTMYEEMEKAHERALMRVAKRFSYLLSPQMQTVLARQTSALSA